VGANLLSSDVLVSSAVLVSSDIPATRVNYTNTSSTQRLPSENHTIRSPATPAAPNEASICQGSPSFRERLHVFAAIPQNISPQQLPVSPAQRSLRAQQPQSPQPAEQQARRNSIYNPQIDSIGSLEPFRKPIDLPSLGDPQTHAAR
jgi:hypothetical protein